MGRRTKMKGKNDYKVYAWISDSALCMHNKIRGSTLKCFITTLRFQTELAKNTRGTRTEPKVLILNSGVMLSLLGLASFYQNPVFAQKVMVTTEFPYLSRWLGIGWIIHKMISIAVEIWHVIESGSHCIFSFWNIFMSCIPKLFFVLCIKSNIFSFLFLWLMFRCLVV